GLSSLQAHRLPSTHPDRLLKAALVELPVEEGMRRLRVAPQRANQGHTVETARKARAGDLSQRRQDIPMRPDVLAHTAGRNRPDPPGDHRHPDAAFVEIAFDAAQAPGALEEDRIAA